MAEAKLPIMVAGSTVDFTISVLKIAGEELVALQLDLDAGRSDRPVLMRLHSGCLTGDVFGSARCDCGSQLGFAIEAIARERRGIIHYIAAHEGRGIGLFEKIKAYALQDQGLNTVQANHKLGHGSDERGYSASALALKASGVSRVRLITNNPAKVAALESFGVEVERIPCPVFDNEHNAEYLATKIGQMGHFSS